MSCQSLLTSASCGWACRRLSSGGTRAQRLEGVRLQGELILGAAHRGVDGQILGRLQIERHARDAVHRLLQTA